ncbi:LuxR C-terminal-related transcriptional regulator [Aurantimicrobium minutum]|uniref:LuxR C-terminal-related transcriptional regulator n=1 Tax=Aurantimicrobium minutum TaxID=708131 RepID=UPI00247515C8|nr:LuxR C-terminal-related transcriptional regulator [Aurantimicrobium minutum]
MTKTTSENQMDFPLAISQMANQRDFPLDSVVHRLTRTQFEVFQAVATGMTNREIADLLDVRENTAANHLIAIYDILEIPVNSNRRVATSLLFHLEIQRSNQLNLTTEDQLKQLIKKIFSEF